MKPIKIYIVEDNPEYIDVLATSLDEENSFELIAQHTSAYSALAQLSEKEPPDVILLDLNLPGMSGLNAIPEFMRLAPDAAILVLTCSEEEKDISEAFSQGAAGYLLKDSSLEDITAGVHAVVAGGNPIDPKMACYLLNKHSKASAEDKSQSLTKRELEILEQIAKGLSQKQIGDLLNISHKTVEFHARRIYKKLEAANAAAAVAKAYEAGDLPLN